MGGGGDKRKGRPSRAHRQRGAGVAARGAGICRFWRRHLRHLPLLPLLSLRRGGEWPCGWGDGAGCGGPTCCAGSAGPAPLVWGDSVAPTEPQSPGWVCLCCHVWPATVTLYRLSYHNCIKVYTELQLPGCKCRVVLLFSRGLSCVWARSGEELPWVGAHGVLLAVTCHNV